MSNNDIGEFADSLSAGNYIVTITDANGCILIDSTAVTQPTESVNAFVASSNITCFGGFDGSIRIIADGGTPTYQYSLDGETYNGVSEIPGLSAGTYNIFVKDANGCTYFQSGITITEPPAISVSLGQDSTINLGDTIQIFPLVSNAFGQINYFWSEEDTLHFWCNDDLCANPFASPVFQESYQLTVVDENGCEASDILTLFIIKRRSVEVPTAFSPHSSAGVNDLLNVYGKSGTKINTFKVFDRWGEMVFEANDFMVNEESIGWDGTFRGKVLETGVYVWYIEAEYLLDGQKEVFKGSTNLVR